MNERIEQLAEQCWTHTNEPLYSANSRSPHWEFDRHKFAQLIVQECIDNVKVWEKDSRNHISYLLKKHFEVNQ